MEGGAYTGIIDYHAPTDVQVAAKPLVPTHVHQARPKDKLRVGCIGAGGFARGVIFPHAPLLRRADIGVCCHQHRSCCRIGAHADLVSPWLNPPPNCSSTPTWTWFSSLPGITVTPPTWRAPWSRESLFLSKSRWRSIANSWKWFERHTRELWRKTDRLFSWLVSIVDSRRLRRG